jgi:DNA-binding transcriptional LysR family regulator
MKRDFTIRRGALDGVEVFLAVARLRSFRQAAARLGITPSAVSQAVRALEGRLDAALLIRTTRSVGLTEAGQRFFEGAAPAFEELVVASEAVRNLGRRPVGLLRLSVPRAVVPLILEPMIASFCESYPEIEVEIAASEELVDLAAKGFDAGIRLGHMIAPDMVVVRLTPPFPFAVVGSPEYFGRRGRPQRLEDLASHACLRMRRSNGSIAPWAFVDGNRLIEAVVSGPLIAHDYPTLSGAALRGVGLAQLPAPLVAASVADGRLQTVLAPFESTTPGLYLYYTSRRQILPKLRAFIDHIKRADARQASAINSKAATTSPT